MKNFFRKMDNDVNSNIMGFGIIYAIISMGIIIWLVQNPYYSEVTVHTLLASVILYILFALLYVPCVIYNNIMTNKEETIELYNDVVAIIGEDIVKQVINDKKSFKELLRNEIARITDEEEIIACQKIAEPCLTGERLAEVHEREDILCQEYHKLNRMLNNISYRELHPLKIFDF